MREMSGFANALDVAIAGARCDPYHYYLMADPKLCSSGFASGQISCTKPCRLPIAQSRSLSRIGTVHQNLASLGRRFAAMLITGLSSMRSHLRNDESETATAVAGVFESMIQIIVQTRELLGW